MSAASRSSCPTTDELAAYTDGRLTGADRTLVERHVSSCRPCQHEVDLARSKQGPTGAAGASSGLQKGARLGQYELLEAVGGGGMGVVYKALHTRLHQVVAVKTMARRTVGEAAAVVRFHREMAALGALIHPNIVRATDAGECDGRHYLVMEFVDGVDLNRLVQRCGPLPVADACALARHVAVGLQFIHENRRVHRDIKPSNIMLSRHGEVKILDLGLALLNEPTEEELTGSRQAMGTADYMAPEQAQSSHHVDIRADLYSLGCTLCKLLTGSAPFGSHRDKQLAHAKLAPPSITQLRPEVPASLARLVERLVAKDPGRRFQQPADVAEALVPFARTADLVELARCGTNQGDAPNPAPPSGLQETLLDGSALATASAAGESAANGRPRWAATAWWVGSMTLVCLAVLGAWAASNWWNGKDRTVKPEEDHLPWPPGYPAAMRVMEWDRPLVLVDQRDARPRHPHDSFRGNNNAGPRTFQPLWCRRPLGLGRYYEADRELQLYAGQPASLTFLELSRDLKERWFEVDLELEPRDGADSVGGLYVGWQEEQPGRARSYLLFLERGPLANHLHVAPVEVRWQRAEEPEPVHPFEDVGGARAVVLEAPQVHRFNRLQVRATPGKLAVAVEGGAKTTIATPFDPRGALGLWVQQGWVYCGRLTFTPLRGPGFD